MRCVLDPNVLVSALLSRESSAAQLLRLWLEGAFEVVVSPKLLSELYRTLHYPLISAHITTDEATTFAFMVRQLAQIRSDPTGPTASTEPNGHYLVDLARAARTVVVSVDKHLHDLRDFRPIYTPAEFTDAVRSGSMNAFIRP